MAEEADEQHRPVMLCATSVLKPGPTRIGRIGGNITLPRTVTLPNLLAGGGGAFLGALVGMAVIGGLQAILMGATFLGAVGVFVVNYQPMKGESMLRWLGLEVMARRNRVEVDGQLAQAYIGICPITYLEQGLVRIVPGAVNVPAGSVDERGVFVSDAYAQQGGLLKRLGAKQRAAAFAAGDLPGPVELPDERAPQWAIRKGIALPDHAPDAWAAAAATPGAPAWPGMHPSAAPHHRAGHTEACPSTPSDRPASHTSPPQGPHHPLAPQHAPPDGAHRHVPPQRGASPPR